MVPSRDISVRLHAHPWEHPTISSVRANSLDPGNSNRSPAPINETTRKHQPTLKAFQTHANYLTARTFPRCFGTTHHSRSRGTHHGPILLSDQTMDILRGRQLRLRYSAWVPTNSSGCIVAGAGPRSGSNDLPSLHHVLGAANAPHRDWDSTTAMIMDRDIFLPPSIKYVLAATTIDGFSPTVLGRRVIRRFAPFTCL